MTKLLELPMKRMACTLAVAACLAASVAAKPALAQRAGGTQQMAGVPNPAEAPRARVYLIRGLFDVFSLGMDRLGSHLRRQGHQVRVVAVAGTEALAVEIIARRRANPSESIVVIGHSLGADAAVRIANRVGREGLSPLDLVVTFDPTSRQELRGGARRVVNLFQSNNGWAVPLNRAASFSGQFANEDLAGRGGMNHLNIEKSRELHERVLAWVAEAAARARAVSPRPGPAGSRR
jgi:pimeloyl-ACP methyl ester carboxylesterase